jgi:TonB family protein
MVRYMPLTKFRAVAFMITLGNIGWGNKLNKKGGTLKSSFSVLPKLSNSVSNILTLIVFLLSIPVSSAIVELPVSISNNLLKGNFSIVTASKDSIFFNGKPIGSSIIVSKILTSENDPIVQELVSAINALKKKSPLDSIVIQLDNSKPFQYLFTIMNTCGSLNIRHFMLCVKNAKGNQGYVYLKIAAPNLSKTDESCSSGTMTTIIFSDTVITIGYKFGFLASLSTNKKDSVHVLDRLSSILIKMQKKYSNSIDLKSVVLAFDNNYPYSKVIKTLDFAYSFGFTNIEISKLKTSEDSISRQNICTLFNRSRESIRDTISSHMGELKSLFVKNLKTNPNSSGQIIVKFKIAQSGRVIFAQVKEASIQDESFQKNVLDNMRKWNFGEIEKPSDTTEVIYPFVFNK